MHQHYHLLRYIRVRKTFDLILLNNILYLALGRKEHRRSTAARDKTLCRNPNERLDLRVKAFLLYMWLYSQSPLMCRYALSTKFNKNIKLINSFSLKELSEAFL